jgi:hypothetical protein
VVEGGTLWWEAAAEGGGGGWRESEAAEHNTNYLFVGGADYSDGWVQCSW